jgi:hypothetical protein
LRAQDLNPISCTVVGCFFWVLQLVFALH